MGILTNLSLFSGAGGLDLAAKWAGFRTVCYVENDPYAQGVLMSRMRDGSLDNAPIWDDVQTFDGKSWRGLLDVVSGGFPCQDVSVAGKRLGIEKGKRSGLWREFARIICEVGPRYVLVENVPGLIFSGGIGTVLGSLAQSGYDAEWWTLSAAAVGAPHLRNRVWIVADAGCKRNEFWRKAENMASKSSEVKGSALERKRGRDAVGDCGNTLAHAKRQRLQGGDVGRREPGAELPAALCRCGRRHQLWPMWGPEPCVDRVDYGVEFTMDRLRLCGNGVVPQQALPAWEQIVRMAKSEEKS